STSAVRSNDQGRHRRRSFPPGRHHEGQGGAGRRCRIRRDAGVDDAGRANRTARLRRLSGQTAQAGHRPQSPHGQGSPHPTATHQPLPARQGTAEHHRSVRVTDEEDIARAPDVPTVPTGWQPVGWPPAFRPVRRRFQHRWSTHIVLFALTFFTTSFAQAFIVFWGALGTDISPLLGFTREVFLNGLWYSLPLLAILSAHEFGHYFACRIHRVDATLPYFIPAPLPLTGTLGAVIRIREAFPSKRALFDIGVAGPIAGFVMLLPFLVWGMSMSTMGPVPADQQSIYFGEPLLWNVVER